MLSLTTVVSPVSENTVSLPDPTAKKEKTTDHEVDSDVVLTGDVACTVRPSSSIPFLKVIHIYVPTHICGVDALRTEPSMHQGSELF